MTQLITHLEQSGFRRLGLVLHRNNEPFPARTTEPHYATLLRGLIERSSITCGPQQQSGAHEREPLQAWFEATRTLLARDPEIDVLLVHTMDQVVPAIEAATRMGRVIGKDLGLATFDGAPIGEWLYGGVTVIHEPARQVADGLADLVLARLNGTARPQSARVEARLVTRATTRGPGN
jgi:DNA-binding LacI/PurR family transcriptional regulator